MNIFALLIVGVLLNSAAQISLKSGMQAIGHFAFTWENIVPIGWQVATNKYIMLGMLCYATSIGIWLLVLSRLPVSVAYPMVSLGYIVAAIAGWYCFGEQLTPMRIAGIALIMAGVAMVGGTA